nr:DegT/DnrJ/EryC1/StrS family aminotransferase [uncultured Dethiosulfovibrio sp.]
MPDRKRLNSYIDRIYDKVWLTNNGPLVQELTKRLCEYLEVENLLLVSNGTLALQIAYKVLGLAGSIITTPFSFVATTSSIAWEGMKPVFSDIDPNSFCLNPSLIKKSMKDDVSALVPVHVFGNACDVEFIASIAKKNALKVVYDASHAFGVKYKGKGLLSYGDAATLSFHATKIYHTIEGGAVIFKKKDDLERAKLLINFGIKKPNKITCLGINAKMNEFQAAMGLAMLDEIDTIMDKRSQIWHRYEKQLKNYIKLQKINTKSTNNYAYFPVVFENEKLLLLAKGNLKKEGINPRRYFYPSLDTMPYVEKYTMPISRKTSSRIMCLPIYGELKICDVDTISNIIKKTIIK